MGEGFADAIQRGHVGALWRITFVADLAKFLRSVTSDFDNLLAGYVQRLILLGVTALECCYPLGRFFGKRRANRAFLPAIHSAPSGAVKFERPFL